MKTVCGSIKDDGARLLLECLQSILADKNLAAYVNEYPARDLLVIVP